MAKRLIYKPRNKLAYVTKTKLNPYKNGYLRHFYTLRGKRFRRQQSIFRSCILVAKTIKWKVARRFIQPLRQRSGTKTLSFTNKKAFGRPFKRRYRNMFYAKQQLRFFYGEIKEETFRIFFRKYKQSALIRSNSFFTALESRLDIIFFRIRIFPTVFACRQFIYHQGLEVNGFIEKSPRALVRIGDRISISPFIWKSVYADLFVRVYYRRWGLYILRRRMIKQINKLNSFLYKTNTFYKRNRSRPTYSLYFNKTIFGRFSTIKTIKTVSRQIINESGSFSTLKIQRKPNLQFNKIMNVYRWYRSKFYKKQIRNTDNLFVKKKRIQKLNIIYTTYKNKYTKRNKLINYSINNGRQIKQSAFYQYKIAFQKSGESHWLTSGNKLDFKKIKMSFFNNQVSYKKTLIDFKSDCLAVDIPTLKNKAYLEKLYLYQKLVLSKRFEKSFLSMRRNKRAIRLRFYTKRYKKNLRYKKLIRLKGVHFFIPNYLQRDFRTLRARIRHSPNRETIYYSFRISLAKMYSFYRAKGF